MNKKYELVAERNCLEMEAEATKLRLHNIIRRIIAINDELKVLDET